MRIRGIKRTLTAGLVLALAFTAVGCSSSNGNTSAGSTSGPKKIKLTVSSTMSSNDRIKMMDETIKVFNKKHPEIEVAYTAVGQDYNKNLKLSFSSGEGDDVVYLDDINQQMLQQNNYLMDLTSEVQSKGYLDKQIPGAVEFNNIRTPGKYYSVPFLMAPVVVYYNKDIFKKLNLTPPKTVDEFQTILEKAKAAGYTPMENSGLSNYQLMWTVYSLLYGNVDMKEVNDFYYQKGATPAFETAMVSSLSKVEDWVKKGYYRKDMASIDDSALLPLFSKGESAMMVDGDWNLPSYVDMKKVDVGVFPFPRVNPDMPNTIVNATDGAWALNAKLENDKKQAALEFVDIFMDPEVTKIWSEGGLTSSVKHDESTYKLSPLKQELNKAVADTKIGFYLDNAVPGILDVIAKETQRMMLAQITPQQTWDNIKKEYEKLVKQAQKP
jgi:raffinose/stachyose/melibiose transport system substrate-binding protein